MTPRTSKPGSKLPRPLRSFSLSGFKAISAMVLLLCTNAPGPIHAAMAMPEHPAKPDRPKIEDPDSLVQRYLKAVDRGELEIFGQKLDRSMIVPARVEYVYELSGRTTRIKVYSNLNPVLPVPGRSDCRILGVSAVLEDGTITEIESHVWMK